MNSRHKGYIWGLLFSLSILYTSQTLAQHGHITALENTYQHSLKDANPWSGTIYGSAYGPETDIIWKVADNRREYGHKRYDELSPEQREKLRQRRNDFNALSQEEQERIHRARDKFRNMPPEKREKLKEKWRNMSPEERNKAHKNRDHKDKSHKKKYGSYK